jgi:hypothetical protein
MAAQVELTQDERNAQKSYWMEHSSQPTVEAMMLDSKAAEIDQLERPEVSQTQQSQLLTNAVQSLPVTVSRTTLSACPIVLSLLHSCVMQRFSSCCSCTM